MPLNPIILALGIALGCGQTVRMPSDSATGLPATPTVAVSVDSTSLSPGGRLRITVKVTNSSDAPLRLEFSTGCQTDFELLDAQGAVVGESGQMCTEALTRRVLAPRESFTDTHIWVRGLRGSPQPPPGSTSVGIRGVLLATGVRAAASNTVTVALR
jgi:hypothetical protein